jgi:DNA-binding response OmpR family regulator
MRKRILIVEDDEVVADHLAALVREKLGCVPVVSTTSGAAMTRSGGIDFGFLDIKLGDGDVFQLASQFRQQGVPFVFVSATDPIAVPRELAAAPFLRKPVSPPDLVAAARRHLAARP